MLIPSLDHHGGSGLHNRHLIGVRLGVLVNFVLQAIWLDERHNAIALCPRTNGKSRPATANGQGRSNHALLRGPRANSEHFAAKVRPIAPATATGEASL